MAKLTLNDVGDLRNTTTAATTINNNNASIETAIENTLSLDGTTPNSMASELDMDSHQILNLPPPAGANNPLRLQDLSDFVGGGTVANIPSGGTTGQVLAKASSTNYDTEWRNSVTSVGLALPSDFVVTGSPVTTTGTLTGAWNTKTANTVLSGPASGSAATPTFRALQGGDLPNPSASTKGGVQSYAAVTNQFLTSISTGGVPASARPSAANLSDGVTGTGAVVLANTPTLITPVLGVATATSVNKVAVTAPATSATLTIPNGVTLTGPASSGTVMTLGNAETITGVKTFGAVGNVSKLVLAGNSSGSTVLNAASSASGVLTLPAATDFLIGKDTTDILTNKTYDTAGTGNSFSINGVAATANTGTGAVARATSPTFVTPALGTPSSGTLTSCTGLPVSTGVSGLGTGVATFLATPSSANLGSALTDKTGTGVNVFATSPTLVTPTLGVATATSINGNTLTTGTGTLTLGAGKTATVNNTLTLAGTDSTTITFQGTDTYVGRTTTDTLTNKTLNQPIIVGTTTNDNAATGNVGEYVSSNILIGSEVTLTNNIVANVTSISLTAGDWDISSTALFDIGAGTTYTQFINSISATSATLDTSLGSRYFVRAYPTGNTSGLPETVGVARARFSLASTTTIYFVVRALFGVSTMKVYGEITARRIR